MVHQKHISRVKCFQYSRASMTSPQIEKNLKQLKSTKGGYGYPMYTYIHMQGPWDKPSWGPENATNREKRTVCSSGTLLSFCMIEMLRVTIFRIPQRKPLYHLLTWKCTTPINLATCSSRTLFSTSILVCPATLLWISSPLLPNPLTQHSPSVPAIHGAQL